MLHIYARVLRFHQGNAGLVEVLEIKWKGSLIRKLIKQVSPLICVKQINYSRWLWNVSCKKTVTYVTE